MPTNLFQPGNTAAKGKLGKQHARTEQFKEFANQFNKAAWPKVLARMDEISPDTLAKLIMMFQNYCDPIRKQIEIEHSKTLTVPKEIEMMSVAQAEAMLRIMNGEQPTFEVIPQLTNGNN